MKIKEILLTEAYMDELNNAIMNLIVMLKSDDKEEVSTFQLRKKLSKEGYMLSTNELLTVLDDLDIVSSADRDTVTFNGEPEDDEILDMDELPDVSDQNFDDETDTDRMDQEVSDMDDTSDEIVSDLATKQAQRSIR